MGNSIASVLWRGPEEMVADLCELSATDSGFALEGVVLFAAEEGPAEVRYRVEVDERWRTRAVRVAANGGIEGMVRLEADGEGNWTIDGEPALQLNDCIDVDLGATPATNTLPIRREPLEVGGAKDFLMAWVLFPELTVESGAQRYERLGERTYRYSSEGFVANLRVDEHGLVVDYGDYWHAAAHNP